MSTNRNIVEMVEAIRKGTGGSNSADGVDGTYMADVLSVKQYNYHKEPLHQSGTDAECFG